MAVCTKKCRGSKLKGKDSNKQLFPYSFGRICTRKKPGLIRLADTQERQPCECYHQWGCSLEGCRGPASRPPYLKLERGGHIRDLTLKGRPSRLLWQPIPPALVGSAQLQVSGNASCWFIVKIPSSFKSRKAGRVITNRHMPSPWNLTRCPQKTQDLLFMPSAAQVQSPNSNSKNARLKGAFSAVKPTFRAEKPDFTARKASLSARKVCFSTEEVPFQYLHFLLGFCLRRAVAKFIIPDWGDKVDFWIGLLYRPAR